MKMTLKLKLTISTMLNTVKALLGPLTIKRPFSYKKDYREKCNVFVKAHDVFRRNLANF